MKTCIKLFFIWVPLSILFFVSLNSCDSCNSKKKENSFCYEANFELRLTEDGYKGSFLVPNNMPPGKNLTTITIASENKKYIIKISGRAPELSTSGVLCQYNYPGGEIAGTVFKENKFKESVDGDLITYTAENGGTNIIEGLNCRCDLYNGNWEFEVLFSKEYYSAETVSKKLKVCFYYQDIIYADPKDISK